MKSSCPTTQHILACAKAAQSLGEPTCLTKIAGVLVTVHAPVPPNVFECRVGSKTVACRMLRDGAGQPYQLPKDLHSAN